MAGDDKIKAEKLQYDINRGRAKTSALSSVKIDKYYGLRYYVTGDEVLPPDQRRGIEQAKFAYLPLGKAFEKQTKMIKYQGKNRIKAIEDNGKQLVNSNEFLY